MAVGGKLASYLKQCGSPTRAGRLGMYLGPKVLPAWTTPRHPMQLDKAGELRLAGRHDIGHDDGNTRGGANAKAEGSERAREACLRRGLCCRAAWRRQCAPAPSRCQRAQGLANRVRQSGIRNRNRPLAVAGSGPWRVRPSAWPQQSLLPPLVSGVSTAERLGSPLVETCARYNSEPTIMRACRRPRLGCAPCV